MTFLMVGSFHVQRVRQAIGCSLLLAFMLGCPAANSVPENEDPPADAQPAPTASAPKPQDDAAAVTALESLAKELKRDGDGNIVEVNFRETKIDDSCSNISRDCRS